MDAIARHAGAPLQLGSFAGIDQQTAAKAARGPVLTAQHQSALDAKQRRPADAVGFQRSQPRRHMLGEVGQRVDVDVSELGGRLQHSSIALGEQVVEVADLSGGDVVGGILRHPDGVVDLQLGPDLLENVSDGHPGLPRAQESFLQAGPSGTHLDGQIAEQVGSAGGGYLVQVNGKFRYRRRPHLDVVHVVGSVPFGEVVEETRQDHLLSCVGGVGVHGTDQRNRHVRIFAQNHSPDAAVGRVKPVASGPERCFADAHPDAGRGSGVASFGNFALAVLVVNLFDYFKDLSVGSVLV